MWLKSLDEVSKYIPTDNKYHDVQIIGDGIFVDRKHQNTFLEGSIEDIIVKNRALSAEEIAKLYKGAIV